MYERHQGWGKQDGREDSLDLEVPMHPQCQGRRAVTLCLQSTVAHFLQH
jgi:hypothetical protein